LHRPTTHRYRRIIHAPPTTISGLTRRGRGRIAAPGEGAAGLRGSPHPGPLPEGEGSLLVVAVLGTGHPLGDHDPVAEGFDQRVADSFKKDLIVDRRLGPG